MRSLLLLALFSYSFAVCAMETHFINSVGLVEQIKAQGPTVSSFGLPTQIDQLCDSSSQLQKLYAQVVSECGMSFMQYAEQNPELDHPRGLFYDNSYLSTEFADNKLLEVFRADDHHYPKTALSSVVERKIDSTKKTSTAQRLSEASNPTGRFFILPVDGKTDGLSVLLVSHENLNSEKVVFEVHTNYNDGSSTKRILLEASFSRLWSEAVQGVFYDSGSQSTSVDLVVGGKDKHRFSRFVEHPPIYSVTSGEVKDTTDSYEKVPMWRQYADGTVVYMNKKREICFSDSVAKKEEVVAKLPACDYYSKVRSIDLSPNKKSIVCVINDVCSVYQNILLLNVVTKKIRALWCSPLLVSAHFMYDSIHCVCTTEQDEGQLLRVMNFFLPACIDSDGFAYVNWSIYQEPKLQMKKHSENSFEPFKQVYPFDGEPFDVTTCMVHVFDNTKMGKVVSTHRQKPLVSVNGQIYEEVRAAEISKLTTVEQLKQALRLIREKKQQRVLDDSVVQEIVKNCLLHS